MVNLLQENGWNDWNLVERLELASSDAYFTILSANASTSDR
jgi:hypothetical protein